MHKDVTLGFNTHFGLIKNGTIWKKDRGNLPKGKFSKRMETETRHRN